MMHRTSFSCHKYYPTNASVCFLRSLLELRFACQSFLPFRKIKLEVEVGHIYMAFQNTCIEPPNIPVMSVDKKLGVYYVTLTTLILGALGTTVAMHIYIYTNIYINAYILKYIYTYIKNCNVGQVLRLTRLAALGGY